MKSLNDQLLARGLVTGHFIFASKRHGVEKFDFDRIASKRRLKKKTARKLGALVAEAFPDCDAIVTVADGANCLSAPVAKEVGKRLGRHIIPMVTAKRKDGEGFYIQRGNIHVQDLNCVVVDDVYTLGTNTGRVSRLITRFDGIVNGVAVVLNRNREGARELDYGEGVVPLVSLIERPAEDYAPEECPSPVCELDRAADVVDG